MTTYMSTDDFSTPLSSLPMASTRDDKPDLNRAGISYDEILAMNENEMNQAPLKEDGPVEQPYQQQQQPLQQQHMMQSYPQQMMQPYPQQMMQPYPAPPQMAPPPPASDPPPQQQSGLKGLVAQHKHSLVVAVVIFTLFTFVYPRLKTIPRFASIDGLPVYALLLLSMAGSGAVTAAEYVL